MHTNGHRVCRVVSSRKCKAIDLATSTAIIDDIDTEAKNLSVHQKYGLSKSMYKDVEEISRSILLARGKDFVFLLDFPEFDLGNGWLRRFKRRYSIVCQSVAGEGASVDVVKADQ